MADKSILTRAGVAAPLSAAEYDQNVDSQAGVVDAKTNDYTVLYTDQNKTIEFTKGTSVTCTIDAVATIIAAIDTSEWKVTIKNLGAGVCTINPNAAETIDGSATYALNQYESATIQLDDAGTGWNIIGNSGVSETKTQTFTNKTLTSPTLTSPVLNTGVSGTAIKDEDDMSSDSASHLCTQQSIKAYVDTEQIGKPQVVYKTANQILTTAVMANVTDMVFTNLSVGWYHFDMFLMELHTTDLLSIDFTLSNVSGGMSRFAAMAQTGGAIYNEVGPVGTAFTSTDVTSVAGYYHQQGIFEVTNATNTIQLQASKSTDVSTDSTIYEGSSFIVSKLS